MARPFASTLQISFDLLVLHHSISFSTLDLAATLLTISSHDLIQHHSIYAFSLSFFNLRK